MFPYDDYIQVICSPADCVRSGVSFLLRVSWEKCVKHGMASFKLLFCCQWFSVNMTPFWLPWVFPGLDPCSSFEQPLSCPSPQPPSPKVPASSFLGAKCFFSKYGWFVWAGPGGSVSVGFGNLLGKASQPSPLDLSTDSKYNQALVSDLEQWQLLAALWAGSHSWGEVGGWRWQEMEHQLCLKNNLFGYFVISDTCKTTDM